ncbi:unnamed protein product [Owenia fusiformis]|uniref:Trichoplein keratin filament-binding protein n=1 Tax=Owenia fusiformis TaxID=6347 RepID=A0A8S4Q5C9_OWEFU|nr:unnamed protein product [Owenia fusiformis]
MALPHMPTSYTTRKNIYEAAIVRRRNHDNDFHEKWSKHASYFNQSNVEATKQTAWQSNESFHNSMDAYRDQHDRETKVLLLKKRRLKLGKLLKNESNQYEAELKGVSRGNFDLMEDMKERTDELKSAREEKRKKIAEEKLYDHFRKNNPDLRELETEQHKRHVIGAWGEQASEKQQELENARREKERYEEELERRRRAAIEHERSLEEQKYNKEKEIKQVLMTQVQELKAREKEADILKREQDLLLKEQWELEQLEVERRQMEDQRRQKEFGRILLRQHTAALRRKSKQILEELEADRKFLESMMEKEREDQTVKTARREKAKADAEWMKKVIDDQIRVEKVREAELDMLYQDEAARVWQKREAEWAQERNARERLMKEIMAGRQEQIAQKMEEVKQQQQESLERREQLVRDMELAQQMTHREAQQTERAKSERKTELQSQMRARLQQEEEDRWRQLQELEQDKHAEDDYEEMLRQEAGRMNLHGFQPKKHNIGGGSTRRQAWN